MTPDRWQQIEEIFNQALEQSEQDRASFLDAVCKDDPALRQEVISLLEQEGKPDFIKQAVAGAAESVITIGSERSVGKRIGSYRITGIIGHGGMGSVYSAIRDDDQYQKRVAIKLIKVGAGTESVQQRFRHERQILAGLEHPHIARLLDGGTTEDGLPYIVMEYIEGKPITRYCQEKGLSIRSRLALFRLVCEAVQYAHRNLIVHRDIKPSNILVTQEGIPKLLDFGIAKLLRTNDGGMEMMHTMTALPFTPYYASPEHVRGETVTTATDIYSLGVILYEILTGIRPYNFKTLTGAEIERVITDTQPLKPSEAIERAGDSSTRLRKQLAGDLDNIVLMALRKEANRRYSSVEQFSEDIRKHIEGLPVLARKDTYFYHATKFATRNKWGIAALTIVMLSLLGGIFAANYQAKRAAAEAERAQRRFAQVRKLANTFLFDFHDKIRNLPGSTEAREMVVRTALEYLDSLAQEAEGDPELLWELAEAYQKVAEVQGSPFTPNLGQSEAAITSYEKALQIRKRLVENDATNLRLLRSLSKDYYNLGSILHTHNTALAMKNHQAGLEVARKLMTLSGSTEDYSLIVSGHNKIGDVLTKTGDAKEALHRYLEALASAKIWYQETGEDQAYRTLATCYRRVGDAHWDSGDLDGTITNFQESIKIRENRFQAKSDDPEAARDLVVIYMIIADVYGNPYMLNLGDIQKAVEFTNKSLFHAEKLADADPKNAQAQNDLCHIYRRLGDLFYTSDHEKAVQYYGKVVEISERALQGSTQNNLFRNMLASTLARAALPTQDSGQGKKALEFLQRALQIQQTHSATDPDDTQIRQNMVITYNIMGDVLLKQKQGTQALESYEQAMHIAESIAKRASNLIAVRDLADCYERIGSYYSSIDDLETSKSWYRKSLRIWDEWPKRAASSSYNVKRRDQARLKSS